MLQAPVAKAHQVTDPRRLAAKVEDGSAAPSLREIAQDVGIKAIKEAMQRSKMIGEPVVVRTAISPVTAAWLLGMNIQNRMLSEPKVIQQSNDMTEGRWQENGDGLAISKCGALNNGQHRNYSVLRSGVTIMTNVTVGLTRESRATNDIGLPRSLSNVLAMDGFENPTIVGVMTKLIIGWEAAGTAATRPARESSAPRIKDRIASDADIRASAAYTKRVKSKARGVLSIAQIGFLHYMLKKHAPEDAERFLTGFVTGAEDGRGLDLDDPRHVARDRLIRDSKRLENADRFELAFRCWNLWRSGGQITKYILNGTIPPLA